MTRTRLSITSPAAPVVLVLALVAGVVLALGATATAGYAASKVKGDATIKKHSLSGNRLKSDTVTGVEVVEASLGTVPRAASVDAVPAPTPRAELVLGTGWTGIGPVSETRAVGYRKDAGGVVHLQGAVGRTSGTNDVISQLPPGFRPAGKVYLLAFANGGTTAALEVDPDGALRYFGGGQETFISLEDVSFIADQ
jgi:hypothetical protein